MVGRDRHGETDIRIQGYLGSHFHVPCGLSVGVHPRDGWGVQGNGYQNERWRATLCDFQPIEKIPCNHDGTRSDTREYRMVLIGVERK